MTPLVELHREIEERAREIAAVSGGWPCHKGCDLCCRRLADVPRLTGAERDLLAEGVARLPAEVRREVEERVREMAHAAPPIVCPFLDRDAGACLVYDCRPVACRTYGFYVERENGLYCGTIREMAEAGRCEVVVWGNACAVEAKLRTYDPAAGPVDSRNTSSGSSTTSRPGDLPSAASGTSI